MKYALSVDIGASSGRHIVGWYYKDKIKTEEILICTLKVCNFLGADKIRVVFLHVYENLFCFIYGKLFKSEYFGLSFF